MGFKENLKNIRKEKKLSQKALGELIGKKKLLFVIMKVEK